MLNKIDKELQYIKDVKNEIIRKINEAPDGSLRCATSKGYHQYYVGKNYIRSNRKEVAVKLAEKEYCLKLQKEIKKYEYALKKVRNYIEEERLQNIYRNLHSGRKVLVTPFYKPIEEIIDEFEKIEYKSKEFTEDDTTSYYTVKGERVRSKSEKIIADELYRCGVPYKYELPIELQGWNKMIEIYPDFTVLNRRTGKKWILEHFGMMDNPDYYHSAMQKLDTFEKNDILLGRDLLILHETSTSPLNTTVLQKYITQFWC